MSLEHHGKRELPIIKEMIQICQLLHGKNMLAATDGNVSYRISDDRILITESGRAKAFLEPTDMAVVNLDGEIISGKPSSERLMHVAVFQNCPEAKAVIHAHPPHAAAWTIAKPELKELPCESMSELILATGSVPIVPYARPGTAAMGENLLPYVKNHKCMILARHGGLCWGETLEEAYYGMERIEHSAQMLYLAHTLGGLTTIDKEEISALREIREKQIGMVTL